MTDLRAVPLSVLEVAPIGWNDRQRAAVAERERGQAVGGPQTVRRRFAELLESTRADELMLTTMVHSHADRLRSFELIRALFPGDLPLGRSFKL